jgi:hypothetical protein
MYNKGKSDDSDKFDRNFRRENKKKNSRPNRNEEEEEDFRLSGPIDATEVFKSYEEYEDTK